MPTDYKGPMKTGLWWNSPDSWQVRYERHQERLMRLQEESHKIDLARQSAYTAWRGYPHDSRKAQYYWKQWEKLKARLDMLTEMIYSEKRTIRLIEDGYQEP